uniref:EF-hand domain-containing protein n=1 Tax=Fagus sylvatica TaxID=28930 RepID=A0A2N9IGQ2_FAGSY
MRRCCAGLATTRFTPPTSWPANISVSLSPSSSSATSTSTWGFVKTTTTTIPFTNSGFWLEAEKINGITKNQNQKNQKPLYSLFALSPSSISAANLARLLVINFRWKRTRMDQVDQTQKCSNSSSGGGGLDKTPGGENLSLRCVVLQDSGSDLEKFDLLDPSSSDIVVGSIFLSCFVEDPIETEKSFARRILSIVDYNEDGKLSFSEFSALINAFGNQQAANKKEELFKVADKNGDGVVSMDELADLLAIQQEKEPLINCCPVCGEILEVSDKLNTMVHLTLCFERMETRS